MRCWLSWKETVAKSSFQSIACFHQWYSRNTANSDRCRVLTHNCTTQQSVANPPFDLVAVYLIFHFDLTFRLFLVFHFNRAFRHQFVFDSFRNRLGSDERVVVNRKLSGTCVCTFNLAFKIFLSCARQFLVWKPYSMKETVQMKTV